jgi:hypothetical protein
MERGKEAGAGMSRTLCSLLLVLLAGSAAAKDYDPAAQVDHSAFDALLASYVQADGVRYAEWHASTPDRVRLDEYLAVLAAAEPSKLTRYQRLAFWLNAYNALTLDLVLDHYPVKSIKDVDSPWKRKVVTVEGRELSLDEIENEIIRPGWKEPLVHFALNCAAVSCPPLRAEAYDGRRLHDQLEEQAKSFLADSTTNFVDAKGKLHLSKIFDWYRRDFEQEKVSLVDWLRPYLPALEGRAAKDVKIDFADYDWSLNEAKRE